MIQAAADSSFHTFDQPHLFAIGAIAAVAVGLPLLARRADSPALHRAIRWTLAAMLIVNEMIYWAAELALGGPGEFLRHCLPLHICGAAEFLAAWTLIRPNQYTYEVTYFWGLAGTAQAVLTPNLTVGFPSYWFWQFFITHGGIVTAAVFLTVAMRMRPARGALWRIIVITNLFMLFVAGADWLLGANYMFLCGPPEGASPFFFLPWPWYILLLELVGGASVLLLCIPFAAADRLHARRGPSPCDL